MAVDLLESYQSDIRNSDWTGVDLLDKGFCQGRIYLHGAEVLKQALARFESEGGDSQY